MAPGSTSTTKWTFGSIVCWWDADKLMFRVFYTTNTNPYTFFSRLDVMPRRRFRTALPYTQHGQRLRPWSTWTLCWSTIQICPKQRVPPFHCPFWLGCWLYGECKDTDGQTVCACRHIKPKPWTEQRSSEGNVDFPSGRDIGQPVHLSKQSYSLTKHSKVIKKPKIRHFTVEELCDVSNVQLWPIGRCPH